MDPNSSGSSGGNKIGHDMDVDDPEVRAIRERVRQMEEESARLKEMMALQQQQQSQQPLGDAASEEADHRSIYVGNVDYSVTVDDLTSHFATCGPITRCTILCDKWTGHPKGFAYLEFADVQSVNKAVAELNETLLKTRVIKVMPKRTNIHGFHYMQPQQHAYPPPYSMPRGGSYYGAPRGPRGGGGSYRRPRGFRGAYSGYGGRGGGGRGGHYAPGGYYPGDNFSNSNEASPPFDASNPHMSQ